MIAAGKLLRNERLGSAGGELARGLVYTSAITMALKVAVGRTRPNGGKYSFPSGHSAAAFTAAPILTRNFGGRIGTLEYLAMTSAMARVEDHKHFVSDVVFGAAVGPSVGLGVSDYGGHGARPSLVMSGQKVGLGVRF